jgi:hypothetical protein
VNLLELEILDILEINLGSSCSALLPTPSLATSDRVLGGYCCSKYFRTLFLASRSLIDARGAPRVRGSHGPWCELSQAFPSSLNVHNIFGVDQVAEERCVFGSLGRSVYDLDLQSDEVYLHNIP